MLGGVDARLCMVVILGLGLACRESSRAVRPDDPTPKVDAGKPKPPPVERLPRRHRAEAAACSRVDVPTVTHGKMALGAACASAADCGPSSRCVGGRCRKDDCYEDPDCGAGSACACDPLGAGHRCVTAACRVDADCGGRGCSPTFDFECGAYHGVVGFQCHTSTDACVDDEDCKRTGGGTYCAHEPKSGRWVCGSAMCKG